MNLDFELGNFVVQSGGGTSDYNSLQNKPKINGITLSGNKSADDLGIFDGDYENLTNKPDLFSGDYNDLSNKPNLNLKADLVNGKLKSEQMPTVTKGDVGLGNVDNTSDANKPVSNATQTALNAKQDMLVSGANIKTINNQSIVGSGNIEIGGSGGTTDYDQLSNRPSINGTTLSGNKTASDLGITKSALGLGNVDNTSDLSKPISTATQSALNGKVDKETGKALFSGSYNDLTNRPTIPDAVVANPTATGTETTLNRIQIGNTHYKIDYESITQAVIEYIDETILGGDA